eukprot:scaffold7028_cov243-Pinguiococcus_pyrenoidosus.AAC.15
MAYPHPEGSQGPQQSPEGFLFLGEFMVTFPAVLQRILKISRRRREDRGFFFLSSWLGSNSLSRCRRAQGPVSSFVLVKSSCGSPV